MQTQPDCTHLLEEIAKALANPPVPGWLVSLISVVVGAALALAVQLFLKRVENRWEVTKARRVFYHDIVRLFYAVDAIMGRKESPSPLFPLAGRRDELRMHLTFDAAGYLRSRPDIYFQLPERSTAEMLYACFQGIVESEKRLAVNSRLALRLVAENVERGHLPKKYFRKFLNSEAASRFLTRVHELHTSEQEVAVNTQLDQSMDDPTET